MKYNNGTTQWEHGELRNDYPYDWHKLLGPCPSCGTPCFNYGGGWRCQSSHCFNSANNPAGNLGPAPTWWDKGINVIKDGNAWCAYGEDFINLQESNAGFGDTPQKAVESFLNITA